MCFFSFVSPNKRNSGSFRECLTQRCGMGVIICNLFVCWNLSENPTFPLREGSSKYGISPLFIMATTQELMIRSFFLLERWEIQGEWSVESCLER